MAIKENLHDGVVVLTFKGKLMGGKETNELRDKVENLSDGGVKKLVIDLGKVKWINSTGLGALIACHTAVTSSNGEIKLARLTKKIQSLMIISQLITVFKNYEKVEEAVESFNVPEVTEEAVAG